MELVVNLMIIHRELQPFLNLVFIIRLSNLNGFEIIKLRIPTAANSSLFIQRTLVLHLKQATMYNEKSYVF